MMGRRKACDDHGRKFSNRRDWRAFISAMQCPVDYPRVLHAIRSDLAPVTAPALLNERIE